jgi:hypothetical protein
MGKKTGSGSTSWWCSDSSLATGRDEKDADRCRGSRGGVDLLRDGSCLAEQATSDGRAPSFEWQLRCA